MSIESGSGHERHEQSDGACPICGGTARPQRRNWVSSCTSCGLLMSTLLPFHGRTTGSGSRIDEGERELALESIRKETLADVARMVRAHSTLTRPRLLEVGCGHGWFLGYATQLGFDAIGLEPDFPIARHARARGLRVACGLFPQAIAPHRRFDVVVFNDVLEHLPALPAVVAGIQRCLRPGGLIVINGPSRHGTLFRISELADRLGIAGPFDRMWQRGLPSPHLWYFRPHDVAALLAQIDATEIDRSRVASVRIRGLWNRLRYTGDKSVVGNVALWLGLAAAVPLLGVTPPDIIVQIFRLPHTDAQLAGADHVSRVGSP